MKNKILKIGVISASILVLPFLVGAQGPTDPGEAITGISGVFVLINRAVMWIFGILLALAVIFLLYAAFLYLTSGGEEEKVKSAKNYLIYAIVAIAIAILSRGIVTLVRSFFLTT